MADKTAVIYIAQKCHRLPGFHIPSLYKLNVELPPVPERDQLWNRTNLLPFENMSSLSPHYNILGFRICIYDWLSESLILPLPLAVSRYVLVLTSSLVSFTLLFQSPPLRHGRPIRMGSAGSSDWHTHKHTQSAGWIGLL